MTQKIAGYAGRQLRVDLGTGITRIEELDPMILRKYVGGAGYAARVLFDELPPKLDPLSASNILVVATGPLSLNKIPGGGSVELCFKSPLTGLWGESRSGGDFGPDLKRAGFDFIVIESRSVQPVYLLVESGTAVLRPAAHLRGKTVSEKRAMLAGDFPSVRCSTMVIGPGGEKQVKFATVMVDDRAAGRCGAGAVMGSKNLLAIVVNGQDQVEPAHPDRLKESLKRAFVVLKESPVSAAFRESGTIGDIPSNDDGGDWPTKNWQSNSWGKGTQLFDSYRKHNFLRSYGCYRGCFIACGRKVHVEGGPYPTPEHGGAEYESISSFTAYVLNENMDAAVHSSWLCNELGIDTISTGSVIAFAMECAEKGILGAADFGGLDVRWGSSDALPALVKMIAGREGIGDLLADGVRTAAKKLGQGSHEFAIHVKGLEGPAHDPRSGKALALTYGTASRGMCHIHPVEAMAWDRGKLDWGLRAHGLRDPQSVDRWDETGKGRDVKVLQDGLTLPDILGTCKFFMYAGITVEIWAELLGALTGWDVTAEELLRVGERAINLQRMFNAREGGTPADDRVPARVLAKPSFGKYADQPACAVGDYEGMLSEYYEARDWDPVTGVPRQRKLKQLGLA
jgi:aldehyde:ferredoxin oxidoreductase